MEECLAMLPGDFYSQGMQNTELFRSALLLVRHEDLAALDRRALRDAGIRTIRVFSSGVEAARLLLEEQARRASSSFLLNTGPGVALCHDQLGDMTGDEFVRLLRLHPLLRMFPVIGTVTSSRGNMDAKALEAGYSGILVRPFPLSALSVQLERAAVWRDMVCAGNPKCEDMDAGAFESALEYFSRQSLAQSENPGVVYRKGLSELREGKWDEALACLNRASKLNPESGDIFVALAAGWRSKGNRGKSDAMLQEAVAVFIKNHNWNQAQLVSERLVRDYPNMVHPLQAAARRLIATGKYDDAAQALIRDQTSQECAGEQGKRDIFKQVARGCFASPDAVHAVESLAASLAEAGYQPLGQALRRFVEEHLVDGVESLEEERSVTDFAVASAAQSLASGPIFGDPAVPSNASSAVPSAETISPASPRRTKRKKSSSPEKSTTPPAIELLKEPTTSTTLNGFPLLRDAVAVAKVTLGLFRAGKRQK